MIWSWLHQVRLLRKKGSTNSAVLLLKRCNFSKQHKGKIRGWDGMHCTVLWDTTPSTSSKAFRLSLFSQSAAQGLTGNIQTAGLFKKRPCISFTWINPIHPVRLSLHVPSCLKPRRHEESYKQWDKCITEGQIDRRNPNHSPLPNNTMGF